MFCSKITNYGTNTQRICVIKKQIRPKFRGQLFIPHYSTDKFWLDMDYVWFSVY